MNKIFYMNKKFLIWINFLYEQDFFMNKNVNINIATFDQPKPVIPL